MYGINVEDPENEFLQLTEKSLESVAQALVPGVFWVDFLPFLRYIPEWVPGAGFKKKAANWKIDVLAAKDIPWDAVRRIAVRRVILIEYDLIVLNIICIHRKAVEERTRFASSCSPDRLKGWMDGQMKRCSGMWQGSALLVS